MACWLRLSMHRSRTSRILPVRCERTGPAHKQQVSSSLWCAPDEGRSVLCSARRSLRGASTPRGGASLEGTSSGPTESTYAPPPSVVSAHDSRTAKTHSRAPAGGALLLALPVKARQAFVLSISLTNVLLDTTRSSTACRGWQEINHSLLLIIRLIDD